ncbi:MAG: PAS domain S-box protein, partial [Betaproteobacteria bacterium]
MPASLGLFSVLGHARATWGPDLANPDLWLAAAAAIVFVLAILCWRQRARIERNEMHLRSAFQESPLATAIFNWQRGELLDANRAFFDLLEHSRHAVLGRTLSQLGVRSEAGANTHGLEALFETSKAHQTEAQFRRRSGAFARIWMSARVVDGDASQRRQVVVVFEDITAKQGAVTALERASEDSRALLSATMNAAEDAMFAVDAQLRITTMNAALQRLVRRHLGFNPRIGADALGLVSADRADEVRALFARVLAGPGNQRAQSSMRTPAGEISYFDEVYAPICGRDGDVTGIAVFIRDVTQRHHAEQIIGAVVKGASASLGEAFFRSLVVELAAAIGSRYALVAELLGVQGGKFRTVAMCSDGAVSKNLEYAFEGGPFAATVAHGNCIFPRDVRVHYPQDPMMAQLEIEGYLSVRLLGSSGSVLGVLCVMHDQPIMDTALGEGVLSVFAARAGAELERLQAEGERRRTLAILDETSDFIASCDLHGNLLYLNHAARRLMSIGARDDVRTRKLAELHPASAVRFVTEIGIPRAIESGLWLGETALQPPGGAEVPVSQLIIAHRSQTAGIEYLSTIMRDLTERNRAEQALRVREESMRMAQQVGNLGSWECDLARQTLNWSEQMYRIVGREPSEFEVTFDNWIDVVHPDDAKRLLLVHDDAAVSLRGFSIDHRIRLPDGVIRHVHQRADVMRDEAERPLGLLGTMQDITERHHAEEALRQSERRLRLLVESTEVIPWTATPDDFRFTYVGPQAARVLGFPIVEWYAEGFWAQRMHADDRARVLRHCRDALIDVRDTELEYRMLTIDERIVWLRHIISVVADEGDRPSLQGFLLDITET